MNIVILGQGAIGLLWAAHLSKNNQCTVTLLSAKGEIHDPIFATNIHGFSEQLRIEKSTDKDLEQADLIIVCLKAFHIASAIQCIVPKLSKHTIIGLCHNGLGTLEELKPLLPPEQPMVTLLISHGAYRPHKNHVIHTGLGAADIGLVNGEISDIKKKQLMSVLDSSMPAVNWHENIRIKQWSKLAINSVINPITAINGIKNGQVLADVHTEIIKHLCGEISQVAKREGIDLSADSIATLVSNVAISTAQNYSSMCCDIMAKQPTEIDYINGYVVKCALKHNIDVPTNTSLLRQVKERVKH